MATHEDKAFKTVFGDVFVLILHRLLPLLENLVDAEAAVVSETSSSNNMLQHACCVN